ncbi:MAG TPA: response regulator [Nitrospiraceae bacterium]
MNLLIIDGDHEEREYYARRLRATSSDYVIHEAATGHLGLGMYESHCIDCVILELELPDMSGLGVLVRLVPLAQFPEVPVIVLTRLHFLSLTELAILNGACACLSKNFSSSDFLHEVIDQATSAIRRDPKKTRFAHPALKTCVNGAPTVETLGNMLGPSGS